MSERTVIQAFECAVRDRFPGVAITTGDISGGLASFIMRRNGRECYMRGSVDGLICDDNLNAIACYLESHECCPDCGKELWSQELHDKPGNCPGKPHFS